ncbi:hypothetical protein RAMDARK_1796 [Rickettsia amblyommatis str. Darkwater]|nr:hypothetical protein RAMDARK_1796 [Rickettsia amblyommatis str. Darkwater]
MVIAILEQLFEQPKVHFGEAKRALGAQPHTSFSFISLQM